MVATGGFIDYVLTQGADAVRRYFRECREIGFDVVEISSGFISLPTDDFVRLVAEVQAGSEPWHYGHWACVLR